MLNLGQRDTGFEVRGLLPSVLLSLLASAAATFLLRQLLSAASRGGEGQGPGPGGAGSVNVNVPVIVITVIARNRMGGGPRGMMPPPFFLPFLIGRLIRAKRRAQKGRPRGPRWMR